MDWPAGRRDRFDQRGRDFLLSPDTIKIDSTVGLLQNEGHRVSDDVGLVSAKLLFQDDGFSLAEDDCLGNKPLEVPLIGIRLLPQAQADGEFAEVLLRPAANEMRQQLPGVLKLCKI